MYFTKANVCMHLTGQYNWTKTVKWSKSITPTSLRMAQWITFK